MMCLEKYEGESISNQPNVFLVEIHLFFFDVIALYCDALRPTVFKCHQPRTEKVRILSFVCLFVLRFYGPVNPMGSCRARSVYLTTRLLDRLSPLSG